MISPEDIKKVIAWNELYDLVERQASNSDWHSDGGATWNAVRNEMDELLNLPVAKFKKVEKVINFYLDLSKHAAINPTLAFERLLKDVQKIAEEPVTAMTRDPTNEEIMEAATKLIVDSMTREQFEQSLKDAGIDFYKEIKNKF